MKTSDLLEDIRKRIEEKARSTRPELFDDEDCCGKQPLRESEEQQALKTIAANGVPKKDVRTVYDAFMRFITDRAGFGAFAERAFAAIAKRARRMIDWDGVWEQLYDIYEEVLQSGRPLPEASSEAVEMVCNECGKRFKKRITARTYEVKCPRCGGYDTEPTGVL